MSDDRYEEYRDDVTEIDVSSTDEARREYDLLNREKGTDVEQEIAHNPLLGSLYDKFEEALAEGDPAKAKLYQNLLDGDSDEDDK